MYLDDLDAVDILVKDRERGRWGVTVGNGNQSVSADSPIDSVWITYSYTVYTCPSTYMNAHTYTKAVKEKEMTF